MTHIVGFEVHNLDHRIFQTMRAWLGPRDGADADCMTPVQHFVLDCVCSRAGGDVFQRDIEAHLSVRRSTVSRMLAGMEKNGLIRRESVPEDGRLKKITATDKGLRLHQSVEKARAQIEVRIAQGIPDADLAVFFRVLAQMQDNLADI